MTTTLSLRMPPPPFRVLIAAVAALAALLVTAPAQANERAQAMRNATGAADRALEHADAVAAGRRGDKHELTLALAELAGRRSALSAAEREAAGELLARPTDANDTGQPGGPYTAPPQDTWTACNSVFCFHWVTSTADAPPLAGSAGDNIPDYIDLMADAFGVAYTVENGELGWREPKSDGALGGVAPDRTDVYVKDIGDFAYGYVAPDPAQLPEGPAGTSHAFLVMDDDYSAAEFPKYGGDPEAPMRVTAAHEYNHVLQHAYDSIEDKWMFESTATWVEEVVEPGIDDYHGYVSPWTQLSPLPLTAPSNAKIYGSALWNRWLHDRIDPDVIRRAWEVSYAEEDSFAPGAYDHAIRERGGAGFMPQFIDFAVATAEWGATGSGVHEGGLFPSMARIANGGQVLTLPTDGSTVSGKLDHTGYVLFNVAPSSAPALELTASLPAGTAGGIALVGRTGAAVGGTTTRALTPLPAGGQGKAVLQDPGRFSRITAVIVNADPSYSGFANGDWTWTKDDQAIALAVKAVSGGTQNPGGGNQNPGGGTQNPGGGTQTPGGGTQTPGGGTPAPVQPLGPAQPATPVVKPTAVATRLAKLARSGVLVVSVEADRAGSLKARASLGSRAIGTGKATLAGAGKATLKIKLTPKAKAALRRARKAVKVSVSVTFTPAGGQPVTRTLKLTLRR